jgi:predicted PurR-regulated permease PerM
MSEQGKKMMIAQRVTYIMLSIILFLYGLIAIRNFLYPIAFGFLIAYLLYPIVNQMEKNRVPRILANFIAIICTLSLIIGIVLFISNYIISLSEDMGMMFDKSINNLSEMAARIGHYFGFDRAEIRSMIREQSADFMSVVGANIQAIFTATTSTMVAFGLLPVYIFLFLYYRTKFAYFLLKIVPPHRKLEMVGILREISKVAAHYMGGVLIVVLILAVLNSVGLWIIGMRYAIALGVISAFFNFIPYFGTLLGGLVPLLFAILIENDPGLVFKVVILFVIIQFTENNILTPNIVGNNVKVNPFFIITGLVGASMVWGIPGMLLIVPFLAIMRIIFSHIETLKPYAYLLGQEGTAKHSINIGNFKKTVIYRWYRKMRGGNKEGN